MALLNYLCVSSISLAVQRRTPLEIRQKILAHCDICIGFELCLWSIVGLPGSCACLLHSAILAKVALGELLRLCPGSAGLSTSVEKAKTDCHDKARDWSLFERFRVPKD